MSIIRLSNGMEIINTAVDAGGISYVEYPKKTIRWIYDRYSDIWDAELADGYSAEISSERLWIYDSEFNLKEECWEPRSFGSVLRNYL